MKTQSTVIQTAEDAILLIRAEKARQGIKWDDLADAAGVAPSTLGNWISGVRMPNLETLLPVLHALGLEMAVRRAGGG